MKVLADFHHEELYESLRMLIEDRLGFELYRPVGMEWFEEKFWDIFPARETAEQFLQIGDLDPDTVARMDSEDNFRKLNKETEELAPGVFKVKSNLYPEKHHKGITLQAFKDSEFDVVISSMTKHVEPFKRLIAQYQPKAKHVFQIGNNWQAPGGVHNILTSSAMTRARPGDNFCFYHQEFSLEHFNHDLEGRDPKSVCNMQHIMPHKSLFQNLSNRLLNWNFTAFGACNGGGVPGPDIADIAQTMKSYGWLWHVKKGGDGYGYNMHHAAAIGMPIITKKSYFRGMTAEKLLIDGQTCIDLDVHPVDRVADILNLQFGNYNEWSQRVVDNFRANVDFDREFTNIQNFFGALR